mmetsp:Transcript_52559/g.132131  ORF Transcript_52559/g.132131 Transcript_52559/m.132131 type:complete len:229 (-) Transcript_52559:47-733(-)
MWTSLLPLRVCVWVYVWVYVCGARLSISCLPACVRCRVADCPAYRPCVDPSHQPVTLPHFLVSTYQQRSIRFSRIDVCLSGLVCCRATGWLADLSTGGWPLHARTHHFSERLPHMLVGWMCVWVAACLSVCLPVYLWSMAGWWIPDLQKRQPARHRLQAFTHASIQVRNPQGRHCRHGKASAGMAAGYNLMPNGNPSLISSHIQRERERDHIQERAHPCRPQKRTHAM